MPRIFFPIVLRCFAIILCTVSCATKEGGRKQSLLSVFSESPIFKDNHERAKLSVDEYVTWFSKNRNSLSVKQDTLGFIYTSQFRPSEIDALEFGGSQKMDSILELKNDYCFFLVDLQAKEYLNSQKLRDVSETLYSSFDIQRDFKLVLGNDTLPCGLFIPLRESVAINGHLIYQLGFEHEISNSNDLLGAVLLYNDKLLGAGIVKFKFENDVFANLPTLKTSVKSKG